MNKVHKIAVVGYGNIGKYAVQALNAAPDMELVGVVRRKHSAQNVPPELSDVPVVTSIDELEGVEAAILATPTRTTPEYASDILSKGIHTVEDARRAVEIGAEALVVSNHGGRQLDGVAPTLHVLPEIVAAVGDRIEVLLDGGIRRGSDIVKALCLGARAVMAGRAYAYGLGAAGGAGVSRAIEILRVDLVRTLKLLGCASVAEVDESYVDVSRGW